MGGEASSRVSFAEGRIPRGDLSRQAHGDELADALRFAAGPVAGLFGPESTSWKLGRETFHLLGGGRALLLQIAHPDVARGVFEHSKFQTESFKRALGTFRAMLDIGYGDLAHARRAAERIYAVHTRVRGVRGDGVRYAANSPDALFWVFATLIDGVITNTELFRGPLRRVSLERYWAESRIFAQVFGIPRSSLPETYGAFRAYFDDMVQGQTLKVDAVAREVAEAVFALPLLVGPLRPILRTLTAGMLPRHLREAFGLDWSWRTQAAYRLLARVLRSGVGLTPGPLRHMPQATLGTLRVFFSSRG